jgi:hypothetical protein
VHEHAESSMAADHANLQTANVEAFTAADVITWEAR